MNSPEVIRNMLLFQEKKQDCAKVMMNKRKKKDERGMGPPG